MRRRALLVVAVSVLVSVGAILASNMGFKISYGFVAAATGVSKTGRQTLGLPYLRKPGLDTASDLYQNIQSQGIAALSIERFDPLNDSNSPYPGPAGDFSLASGEGYLIRVASDGDYKIVGSHDPDVQITFKAGAAGISKTGRNFFAPPYHALATTASELLQEIGPVAVQVERFSPLTDTYSPYPGPAGDFSLSRGEAYLVRVVQDVTYVPGHY